MVTATLTAAAVKAQIATQRQRVEALEASLGTMVNGMDKHMVQVQLKYAQGYLEALREQLAALQGHNNPSTDFESSDASADSTATSSIASTTAGTVTNTVAAAGSQVQPAAQTPVLQPHALTPATTAVTEHGHAVASAAAQACIDQQQSQVQYSYFDMRPAAAAAAAAAARQQRVTAAATATGHGPEGLGVLTLSEAGDGAKAAGDAEVVAAGDSSLVDEDDWVCLQDADLNTNNTQRSGWAGLWNWRKADA